MKIFFSVKLGVDNLPKMRNIRFLARSYGGIAQLVEHCAGSAVVSGSTPLTSTTSLDSRFA